MERLSNQKVIENASASSGFPMSIRPRKDDQQDSSFYYQGIDIALSALDAKR